MVLQNNAVCYGYLVSAVKLNPKDGWETQQSDYTLRFTAKTRNEKEEPNTTLLIGLKVGSLDTRFLVLKRRFFFFSEDVFGLF